jgi:hypothetical protein
MGLPELLNGPNPSSAALREAGRLATRGIGVGAQERLAREGEPVRVLISYGPSWFPWYMRRLAERPANLWFVLKSLFRREDLPGPR